MRQLPPSQVRKAGHNGSQSAAVVQQRQDDEDGQRVRRVTAAERRRDRWLGGARDDAKQYDVAAGEERVAWWA